ncbi:Neuraminidase, partial [Nannochloropsis gaditana]
MRSALSLLVLGVTFGSTLVPTAGQDLNLKSIRTVDRSVTNKDTWKMKGNINDPSLTIVPAIGQTGLTVELQDAATDPLNTVAFAASDCRVPAHGRRATCKIRGARVSIKTSRRPKVKTPKTVHAKSYNSTGGYYSVTGTFRGLTFLENPVVSPLTAALRINGSVLSDTLTSCYDLARKSGRNTISHCEPGPPAPTPTWTEQTTAGARRWSSIASSSDGTNLAAVNRDRLNFPIQDGNIWTSTDAGATWTA